MIGGATTCGGMSEHVCFADVRTGAPGRDAGARLTGARLGHAEPSASGGQAKVCGEMLSGQSPHLARRDLNTFFGNDLSRLQAAFTRAMSRLSEEPDMTISDDNDLT